MAPEVLLTLTLFFGAVAFAAARGGEPERLGALILAVWLSVSVGHDTVFGPGGFGEVYWGYVLFDTVELVAILWLALRANRLWPLWAAAAQLICVSGHVAALIQPGGMLRAYWVMTQIPPFIQVLALTWGVAAHARRQRRVGRYRSWRTA